MGYIDRDDYEELLDEIQELAEEYGVYIKGMIAECQSDMDEEDGLEFSYEPCCEDEYSNNDSVEETVQEELDWIRETEELWDLYYCYAEDEGMIF